MAILKCGEHFVVTALLSSIKFPPTRYIGHPNRSSPFLWLANKIVQDLQRCQTHFLSSDTVLYHQKMRYLRLGQSLNTAPQDRKLQYQEECHLNYERMKPVCWPSLIRGGIRLPPTGIGGLALTWPRQDNFTFTFRDRQRPASPMRNVRPRKAILCSPSVSSCTLPQLTYAD